MSTSPPPSFPAAPTQIIGDLPCRSCGYNLRTLATNGLCPECATPIASSLRGDLLREADPNWLRQMHTGCKLEYGAIWAAWISYVFLLPLPFSLYRTFAAPAAAAVMALGTWMLASPDPSGIGEDRYGPLRIWARGLGIVQLAATLILAFSASAPPSVYSLLQGSDRLARMAWGTFLLSYLDRLGRRTARSKIGLSFRIYMFLFIGVSAVSLATWAHDLRAGFKNPNVWAIRYTFSWFNIFFLYGAVGAFANALKSEVTAAAPPSAPTLWRMAGSFLYSARQLFRRKNGDNH
jgi:hypothetical protein